MSPGDEQVRIWKDAVAFFNKYLGFEIYWKIPFKRGLGI
jgi:hypothetical protein